MLTRLIESGVDVIRLNMAHAKHDWTREVIRRIRAVSLRVGREVAIMMDIKGPEIRTGDVAAPIELRAGEIFDFTVKPGGDRDNGEEIRSVDVNYRDLVNDIKVGDIVLVDSGLIRFEVRSKTDNHIRCCVLTPGTLTSRRHINLPGVRVNLPSFTEKDRGDSTVGLEEGIDFLALSFVREAADIHQLRSFLAERGSKVRIVAKIEDQQAISNLDEHHQAPPTCSWSPAVTSASRCPLEDLPVIQHRATRTCLAVGRPVIIATHMLESMISQPVPTRAEITDVANAVYEQAGLRHAFRRNHRRQIPARMRARARLHRPPCGGGTRRGFPRDDRLPRRAHEVHEVGRRHGQRVSGLAYRHLHPPRPQRRRALRPAARPRADPRAHRQPADAAPAPHRPLGRAVLHRCVWRSRRKRSTHAIDMLRDADRIKVGDKLVIISDVLATNDERIDSIQLRTVRDQSGA